MSTDSTVASLFSKSQFLQGLYNLEKLAHVPNETRDESSGDTDFSKPPHQMHKFDNTAFNLLYPDQLPQVLV